MTADIAFAKAGQIGLITLKRPQALNALTLPMIKALQQQLMLWRNDESVQAVVIQGEGEKAFCAGGDVRWLYEAGLAKNPEQMQFFWHEYRLNHYIHHYPKPYISLMNGITMGGGVGISLHGSHPVATERFIFAMPETGIGFFPDIGASFLLSRCPGQVGVYLGLTGNRLNAQEAKFVGLVNYVIASDQLEAVLDSLVQTNFTANAHQQVDACLQRFVMPVGETMLEKDKATIDACFAKDTVEKIMASLQERGDEWSMPLLHNLQQKAPLSLKVTLAQIQKAKSLSMGECMKMDYCLVSQFMRDADFYEGVRALLVDKDKNPQWSPGHLAEVTSARVADYFECGQKELELIEQ
ncbi:enoyl-CoA hydratase/isomerase family protein [Legionella micdadei]|uniref:3-hydroxyisobutyryl-CoA hydrolase n=1 Tax=Legionella micdadei TaxID=451 RepID=A0A098GIK3_LEGMI|nr:enoyl-CoA hydratase/isomerase family protein [Legionella micdadei]ARG97242.1 3-hydroxyisobutyryl-CoA hydrolase [Legionella micdadei]ARH00501.1 3-hydroxyisobutyryl-CoA hydrolase [Legionella micdadei]KTD29151.1 Enoyl-CoA hydratase/carnithine racemase [Legionella micdadei]NSL17474.1 enoyl-CoA hydratase/isomerase family protein [Legionella micdadei]CEG61306.1 3-hydroxyisobutyryl-CoA hydrolase, mitochondrial [Legionella micdadei]